MKLKSLLLGKPLKNNEIVQEKLSILWGLPIMASDAISSVAYAVEEILIVLIPVIGFAATNYTSIVSIPIILLLLILILSYSQIINHYSDGGGSYVVSKENFGKYASLLAAACLIIDYIMTVAVSVSSSTAAFSSALPNMYEHRVLISIFSILIITLLNLRGANESSKIFGIPTYAFIISMIFMILTGFYKYLTNDLNPIHYSGEQIKNIVSNQSIAAMSLILFLRAFSAGSSALTGVEAISNSIPAFKNPSQRNAKYILYILGTIIIFIFGGTSILASILKVIPLEQTTVMSQMAKSIFQGSFMFYVIQFTTSLILLLAANTAYNGLPILLSILAKDDFMPRQFSKRGTKLSFSNGIIFIFITSSMFVIIFQANTHKLIPFYSVGVFISFTLAQAGLFMKLKNSKSFINLFGAIITGIGAIIVFVTKFSHGSWLLLIMIPLIIYLMKYTKNHYENFEKSLKIENFIIENEISKNNNLYIVLVNKINKATIKNLNYALNSSNNVLALHIALDEEKSEKIQKEFKKTNIRLEIIKTDYRDILEPLEQYISKIEKTIQKKESINIVLTKYTSNSYKDEIFHNQSTFFLENRLSRHKNITIIIIPYVY